MTSNMTRTVDSKLEMLGAVSLVNAKYNPFTICFNIIDTCVFVSKHLME